MVFEYVTEGRLLGMNREGEHGARWQETVHYAKSGVHGQTKKSRNLHTDRLTHFGVISSLETD